LSERNSSIRPERECGRKKRNPNVTCSASDNASSNLEPAPIQSLVRELGYTDCDFDYVLQPANVQAFSLSACGHCDSNTAFRRNPIGNHGGCLGYRYCLHKPSKIQQQPFRVSRSGFGPSSHPSSHYPTFALTIRAGNSCTMCRRLFQESERGRDRCKFVRIFNFKPFVEPVASIQDRGINLASLINSNVPSRSYGKCDDSLSSANLFPDL